MTEPWRLIVIGVNLREERAVFKGNEMAVEFVHE
jgi:hypothetical protein